MDTTSFDQALAAAALEMASGSSVPATLDRAVALAMETIESCDAVVVSLFEAGSGRTVAASEESVLDAVQEQFELGAGPALTAYADREPVYSGDLSTDPRWPEYGASVAHRVGLWTVYAMPLTVRDKPMGVLAIYSKRTDAFDEEEIAAAQLVAAHAAVALAGSLSQENMSAALASRTLIGQATGIVMERFSLDATSAFAVLRRLSQAENVKLRDIAARVLDTGSLD